MSTNAAKCLLVSALLLIALVHHCSAAVTTQVLDANCSGTATNTFTDEQNTCTSENGQYYKYTCLEPVPKQDCIFFASCSSNGFGYNSVIECDKCVPSFGQYADFYKCNKADGSFQRFFHYTKNCSGDKSSYDVQTFTTGCVWDGSIPNNYYNKIDACPRTIVQQYFSDKDCTTATASSYTRLADVCTGGGNWLRHCDSYDKPVAATTAAPPPVVTTVKPTTAKPTTAKPTTAKPTTAKPTTAKPTTAKPTTAKPTTAKPTTAKPTTAKPTTAKPTTAKPTTAKPTTAKPTTAKPTTNKPN